jgi:hypothetical protein
LNWCPDGLFQIQAAFNWFSASNGTPDLFNECSIGSIHQVPGAGLSEDSYQVQRSGGGYAGIGGYTNALLPREYLICPLSQPLETGVFYYLEFYVSPDISFMWPSCYTDAVGLALSDSFYYADLLPFEVLPFIPAAEHRGTLITDTVGWTRVSGCYRASGHERFAISATSGRMKRLWF